MKNKTKQRKRIFATALFGVIVATLFPIAMISAVTPTLTPSIPHHTFEGVTNHPIFFNESGQKIGDKRPLVFPGYGDGWFIHASGAPKDGKVVKAVIWAGNCIDLERGETGNLLGEIYNPNNLNLSYDWSCGSVTTIKQDINNPLKLEFYASPELIEGTGQRYIECSLRATDNNKSTYQRIFSKTCVNIPPSSAPVVVGYPIVNAGPNKIVESSKSVKLEGTASHTTGLAMTYNWNCNGGSVSNKTILQPMFNAPSVTKSTQYSCTVTATDTNNKTASSITYITVNPCAPVDTGNPIVDAGPNKIVESSKSVTLQGTASHTKNLAMTYNWECNGGSLSISTVLQPIFNAPSVNSTTTYSCTVTAKDTNNKTASSITYITVNPCSPVETGNPIVDAGPSKSIKSAESVKLEGTASHTKNLAMTYNWECNGGSLSISTVLQPIFNAPSVNSTTTYSCTLTAKDTNNKTASSITQITVNPFVTGNPIVDAGPSKSIESSQSTTLEGTSSHPDNLSMTYNWNCNGGSLSALDVLQPIFNAPSVNLAITYSCTLTGTDSNGKSSSSITYVTVNPVNVIPPAQNNPPSVINNNSSATSGGSTTYVYVYPNENYNPNNPVVTSSPIVDAGPSKNIKSSESITLQGSSSHPNGLGMTYNWNCSGGSLSNSSFLQPIFHAPSISSSVTYSCTLTATDTNYRTASSITYVTVSPEHVTSYELKVSTNIAEYITTTTAVLKGKIDSSSTGNISARFNWGSTTQYVNNTSWLSNKKVGDIISHNVSGLERGRAYHYRIEASVGSTTAYGQNISFITKPNPVNNFIALAHGNRQINLTWVRGNDACYTMVVRKTGGYPSHSADGTVVYYGADNSYLDQNVSNNVWYYYKAWAVGCDQGLYSFSSTTQSRAYTISNAPIVPIIPVIPNAPIVCPSVPVAPISSADVKFFVRNITQDEFCWQSSVNANPGDVIDFKVIITPTGSQSLTNVKLSSLFSSKIISIENCISDCTIESSFLNQEINIGTIKLGESKEFIFRGKILGEEKFQSGTNQLFSTVEVSSKEAETVSKNIVIDMSKEGAGFSPLGSIIDIFGMSGGSFGLFGWLIFFFIIVLLLFMLLVSLFLLSSKNDKRVYAQEDFKAEKSKYFNLR